MTGCYNGMGRGRVGRAVAVAGCVLAVASALAPGLAAQGAKEASGRAKPGAPIAHPASHVQPARGILGNLAGTWRLEIWFAGNFSSTPDVNCIRVLTAPCDDLRLDWTQGLLH